MPSEVVPRRPPSASPEEDNHESPRTLARLPACPDCVPGPTGMAGAAEQAGAAGRATKLYDRTNDAISLDEIERILIFGVGRYVGAF